MESSQKENPMASLWLRNTFDRTFESYCTQLRTGVPTKMVVQDNEDNRLLMDEFGRYLEQRADFEGWDYPPGLFQVVYVDGGDLTEDVITLYNPRRENTGFRSVKNGSLVKRMSQEEADRVRDRSLAAMRSTTNSDCNST